MEIDKLKRLLNELQTKMREKYHRTLPLPELITDRWEKARELGFGEETSIYDSSIVMGNVVVGTNTWIGPNTLLDGSGGTITIGNYCDISAGVQIYTHDTVKACLSGNKNIKKVGSVTIGNNCYIGPMSLISSGVTIGEKCVVCTNSFVNKSFGSNSIIAGTPAAQIGEIIVNQDGDIEMHYYSHNE